MTKAKYPVFFMIAIAALILWARIVPHQAHAMPVLGLFLLMGKSSSKWWMGSLLGLSAYLVSDLYFGLYPGWAFNYIAFLTLVVLGQNMSLNLSGALKSGLLASFLFFTISNLGVFLFSGLYPQTMTGFYQCYLMAVPFFKMTLLSNMSFLVAVSFAVQCFGYFQKKTAQDSIRY